jgi:hypothetical protein
MHKDKHVGLKIGIKIKIRGGYAKSQMRTPRIRRAGDTGAAKQQGKAIRSDASSHSSRRNGGFSPYAAPLNGVNSVS